MVISRKQCAPVITVDIIVHISKSGNKSYNHCLIPFSYDNTPTQVGVGAS